MQSKTGRFRREVLTEMEKDILPYWLKLKDPQGGFFGEVGADGVLHPAAARGAILNARLLWTYSAAYNALGRSEYLDTARWAYDYFVAHFVDAEWGGVFWSLTADAAPLDSKKQLYAQGFAIYGLAEYFRASGDETALDAACRIFDAVQKHFADPLNGGYVEALSREFSPLEDMSLSAHDINADKTMNSHLHLLEAFACLYEVWPDAGLGLRVKELLDIIGRQIMAPSGHLQLYFRNDWTVLPGGISYGHDIETSWLALECAFALKDAEVVERVRPWACAMGVAGNEGLLPDGSMRYERLPDGRYDDSRQWWVQAETVVGNLWLWKYHGDAAALDRALAAWTYIRDHLVDVEGGEWWWAILPDGSIDLSQPKAGFWKCPYHNTRMCLQVLNMIDTNTSF